MGDHESPKSWPLLYLAYHLRLQLVRFVISVICMNKKSRGSVATMLGDRRSEVRIPPGTRDFLFSIMSRQSLVPTQPLQWVLSSFPGVKQPGNGVSDVHLEPSWHWHGKLYTFCIRGGADKSLAQHNCLGKFLCCKMHKWQYLSSFIKCLFVI